MFPLKRLFYPISRYKCCQRNSLNPKRSFSTQRKENLARQLSNKIFESSDTSQVIALIGLSSSVLLVVAGLLLTSNQPAHKVANAGEPRSNSRIVKDGNLRLKRFSSFNTVKHIDQKMTLNLVASVVAETIPKSALKQRYKFTSSLDDGAFGRVFKATDKLTSKEVAIKVVPHRNMSADQVYNEVDVLRRVRGHENIVHLFQVLNCDHKYFLVSELCSGGELLDVLSETAIFNEERASILAKKLASALQHIHKCGFAHCDLKPENIVFADKNFDEVNCKVIDFGVAQELTNDFELTEDNVENCVGTLAYSPPEILYLAEKQPRDKYKYDLSHYDLRKVDMWALGVVLYICLYGCHPFDVKGQGIEEDLVKKVLNHDLSFDVHGPDFRISKSAKDLISGLLHPDPNKRYSTEDVLNHEWVKEINKEEYLSRLPNSWVHGGFIGRGKDEESTLQQERFSDFVTEKATDGLVRALLIAALLNSNPEEEVHVSSRQFLHQAFAILDKDKNGLVSLENIENILQQTSSVQEDEDHTVSAEMINEADFGMILRNYGCVSRKLKKDDRLFAQGAEPQGFYILTKGKCALEFDGRVFHISTPGAMFGISAGLAQRSVTVRALEKSEVTYIPKTIFFRALAGSPALQTKIFEAARLQQAGRVRGLIERLLLERGEKLEKKFFKRGEYLYKIGEKPTDLYFIESGLVSAVAQAVDKKDFVEGPLTMGIAQRRKGDLTGSSIFFKDGKRYCSLQCLTDVEVSVLSLEQLERLMESNKTLQFYLASQAQWRMEQWNMRIAEAERGLTEQQLLPILLNLNENKKKSSRKRKSIHSNSVTKYAKAVQEMESKVYKAGDAVFEKGEKSDKFYVLNSGSAVAEFESKQGEAMIVAQFQPGDHFGERTLLNQRGKHATTVRCVVPCEVLSMSKEKFFELMGDNDTPFAKAVWKASRMRRHRWGKNILVLARNDQEEENKLAEEHLNDEVETDLDTVIERVELTKGEQLFLRGDASDAVYYIHSGELRYLPIDPTQHECKEKSQNVFQAGDALGLDSLGDDFLRRHTCYCSSIRCVISKIPKQTLDSLINHHEYVSDNLKKHFVRVAPLRELERNLDLDLNKEVNDDEDTKTRKLTKFFSSFYTPKAKPEECEKKRNVAGRLSFSQVMEELSKG